jgi:DNA modification methylase
MEAFRIMLGEGPDLAYLSYMANRLRECWRALKPTGSLYLHCDPTMSHKLKLVLDGLFDKHNFRNEITWKRTNAPTASPYKLGSVHDTIFLYAKSSMAELKPVFIPYTSEYIATHFKFRDDRGQYQITPLTAQGVRHGFSGHVWRNVDVTAKGLHWVCPTSLPESVELTGRWAQMNSIEKLEWLDMQGMIYWPEKGTVPRFKRYLSTSQGARLSDTITDVPGVQGASKENMGYPTQKPVTLLERIVQASCPPDGVVLDPFCGCGTTIHAAQNLGRRWIGIDVCAQACKVIQNRIESHFDSLWDDIEFVGMPKTIDDARTLAEYDPFKFEKWAASLTPGMEANKRQRGDSGIDGRGRYPLRKGVFVDVVSQVKGGKAQPAHIQAFNGARQQANADMGVFTCFDEKVTNGMRDAAVNAGRFQKWPVLQIYTVEDYFAERKPDLPLAA